LEHKCVLKSCGKKASQSSRPQTRKIQIIFPRDMCVGKYLSGCQCGILPLAAKLCAQQAASLLAEKTKFFRQV
jgi:hypothetical protein